MTLRPNLRVLSQLGAPRRSNCDRCEPISTRKTSQYERGGLIQREVLWVMEAAGVEPASEKARRAKTTCVSGSQVSATPYKTGKSESRLVRLISAHGYGPKPDAYPAK